MTGVTVKISTTLRAWRLPCLAVSLSRLPTEVERPLEQPQRQGTVRTQLSGLQRRASSLANQRLTFPPSYRHFLLALRCTNGTVPARSEIWPVLMMHSVILFDACKRSSPLSCFLLTLASPPPAQREKAKLPPHIIRPYRTLSTRERERKITISYISSALPRSSRFWSSDWSAHPAHTLAHHLFYFIF